MPRLVVKASTAAPSAGLGLFTLDAIPPARQIVTEEPLVVLAEDAGEDEADISVVEQLRRLPGEIKAKLLQLHGGAEKKCSEEDQKADLTDDHHLLQMRQVVAANGRQLASGQTAVYNKLSRLNHSCAYNCIQEEGCLVSLKALSAGEELFVSYLEDHELLRSVAERQALLRETWQFDCQCPRCRTEMDQGPRADQTRFQDVERLYHQFAEADLDNTAAATAAGSFIEQVQAAALSSELACRLAAEAHIWLADHYRRQRLVHRASAEAVEASHLQLAMHNILGCAGTSSACYCHQGRFCPDLLTLQRLHYQFQRLQQSR